MNLLKDITLGQYVAGNSLIHKIDPRIKIILIFLIMIQLFLNQSWIGFLGFLILFLGITYMARLPFSYVLRGLKPIILLILITLLINAFFTQGTVIKQFNFHFIGNFSISITREGLEYGGKMALRILLLIFITNLLTLTTSPIQLTDALENLLAPLKIIGVPAHEIAMMMTIALRFIPVLIGETDKIIRAQLSRGASFGKGNIFHKAKSFLPVLVPLFVHAFKTAEDLAIAMESRCYRGGQGRTRLKQMQIKNMDIVIVIMLGLLLIISAWWNYYGNL